MSAAKKISELIRQSIIETPWPKSLLSEVGIALSHLGAKASYAVRSSAVQEDGNGAAFAGAAESYLMVPASEIPEKIKAVWASFWLARGIEYRHEQGIPNASFLPAVMVQEMVLDIDASGVMFTRNPSTGEADQVVINSTFGLGEGVVGGELPVDTFIYDVSEKKEILSQISDKNEKFAPNSNGIGTTRVAIDEAKRKTRALTPEVTSRLARIGKGLESHYGYPVDVEFSIVGDEIYILQVRPVTTGEV